jgi:hypothetical protein
MVPLLASLVITPNPLLAIDQLVVFFEVDLLAEVTKLLLIVGRRASVTKPEELVVGVLLTLPEAIRL